MRPATSTILRPLILTVLWALVGLPRPACAGEDAAAGLAGTSLRLADGGSRALRAPRGGALVLVFSSMECPISNAYSPTLNEIAKAFPAEKLTLIGLYVDPDRPDADLVAHAKEYALAFPVAAARDGRLATKLGVKVTPEVAVIDDRDRVRYLGRIDDQWAARGKPNAKSGTHELKDAVTAVLAGKPVARPKVEAVGCPLPEPARAETGPTYSGGVAQILRNRCADCHQPGQVGPFSLLTYEQARKRAGDIAAVVDSRQMPPWKPAPNYGGPFKHPRSMPETEVATLVAWAEAGAPEGEPDKALPPPPSTDGWALGKPDLVVEMPVDFPIPAQGDDVYRCFVIPTDLPEPRYVSAIEYRPGNPSVVHHVLCYVDTSGKARERDQAEPGAGYPCFSGPRIDPHGDLGGWAPGNEASFLPEGIGRSLPRGSDVVMQVHYHPSGKPATDRTRIGLHFTKTPVKQVLHWTAAANRGLVLPKDNPRIEVPARWKVPVDVDAYAVTPHMHLLGKDMTMVLTQPDGTRRPLIRIDDWDFQWQNTYYFETPIRIHAGTYLDVVAHYDNSQGNPRNPNNPPREVTWGEATTDEMCIGFLAVTKAGQDLTRPGEVDDLGSILKRSFEDQARESRAKHRVR